MKNILISILVFCTTAMAYDSYRYGYHPEDISWGERFCEVMKALLLLAFLTPFGWGALFLIICIVVAKSKETAETVAHKDYSPVTRDFHKDLEEIDKDL